MVLSVEYQCTGVCILFVRIRPYMRLQFNPTWLKYHVPEESSIHFDAFNIRSKHKFTWTIKITHSQSPDEYKMQKSSLLIHDQVQCMIYKIRGRKLRDRTTQITRSRLLKTKLSSGDEYKIQKFTFLVQVQVQCMIFKTRRCKLRDRDFRKWNRQAVTKLIKFEDGTLLATGNKKTGRTVASSAELR